MKRIYAREATRKGIDVPEGAMRKVPIIVCQLYIRRDNVMSRKWWKMTLAAKLRSIRIAAKWWNCEQCKKMIFAMSNLFRRDLSL